MKKSILAIACLSLFLFACKKKHDTVSQEVTASYPVISFTGPSVFSIPVGGALPEILASASDTVTGETGLPVTITGTENLDNSVPGLYFVVAEAKNKYGFVTRDQVFVAVTDVPEEQDISGLYLRVGSTVPVNVSKEARGLYYTDNSLGIGTKIPAYFVVIDDTTIELPPQETAFGTLRTSGGFLSMSETDTSYGYKASVSNINDASPRIFVKQ